jgi:hypothetical protein
VLAQILLCSVLAWTVPFPGIAAADRVQDARAPAVPVVPDGPPREPEDSGSPVPEPTTLLLVGGGLVGLAISSKRWRRTLASNGA